GDEHAEVGHVAARGPDLLAVDDPLVAVLHRPGVQTGQVGPGPGLTEELAPGLLAGDDVAQVPLLLLLGAVHDDRRPGQHEAEATRGRQGAEVDDRLLHPHALGPAEALAVPLDRPGGDGPAGLAQALPPLADREVGVPVLGQPALDLLDGVVGCRSIGGVGHRYLSWGRRSTGTAPRARTSAPRLDPRVKLVANRGAPRRRSSTARRAAPPRAARRCSPPGACRRATGRTG